MGDSKERFKRISYSSDGRAKGQHNKLKLWVIIVSDKNVKMG